MKSQPWIKAYEDANVDTGLAAGLSGRAQIGKGMWAMTDLMADMVEQKIGQPKAGATTAWVPSPTAATLHAMHYHQVDVFERAERSSAGQDAGRTVDELLTIPLATGTGVGARGDPRGGRQQLPVDPRLRGALDRRGRRLLEGARHPRRRADGGPRHAADLEPAARQLAAPRRRHRRGRRRRASADGRGRRRAERRRPELPADGAGLRASIAFQAAQELILQGAEQPNGYTEPILHRRRREFKARHSAQ